ncbi:nucleoside hydrolase [Schaalia sp. lx-260]|uniref:nucleoside hydrolase n=1 Tax=Schaalia sp. lx-260 TaxID=2899082 RepID=UPI001E5F4011|nr:nucleoside hydrolase [Schaalia sp. lx-260]MCD4548886.1 nucleoside hydrolase [Schaalia sp. lx-260]
MNIVIDCDPGNGIPGANVDDALALAFALRSQAFHLKAIWTVFGNTSAAEGSRAAQQLLNDLDAPHTRIITGSPQPLSPGGAAWREKLDAPSMAYEVYSLWGATMAPHRDGWGEQHLSSLPDTKNTSTGDAVAQLADNLMTFPTGVTLACLGPLTNIARLITEYPHVCDGIERIALMGGCLGMGQLVDTNFAVDPISARVVLESGMPLTIVPLDVTRTTELSLRRWEQICTEVTKDRARDCELISRWLKPWLAYSQATRPVDGMWIHDLVVLAQLADPSLVQREHAYVAVREDGKLVRNDSATEVDLITAVDNERLIDLWVSTVLG